MDPPLPLSNQPNAVTDADTQETLQSSSRRRLMMMMLQHQQQRPLEISYVPQKSLQNCRNNNMKCSSEQSRGGSSKACGSSSMGDDTTSNSSKGRKSSKTSSRGDVVVGGGTPTSPGKTSAFSTDSITKQAASLSLSDDVKLDLRKLVDLSPSETRKKKHKVNPDLVSGLAKSAFAPLGEGARGGSIVAKTKKAAVATRTDDDTNALGVVVCRGSIINKANASTLLPPGRRVDSGDDELDHGWTLPAAPPNSSSSSSRKERESESGVRAPTPTKRRHDQTTTSRGSPPPTISSKESATGPPPFVELKTTTTAVGSNRSPSPPFGKNRTLRRAASRRSSRRSLLSNASRRSMLSSNGPNSNLSFASSRSLYSMATNRSHYSAATSRGSTAAELEFLMLQRSLSGTSSSQQRSTPPGMVRNMTEASIRRHHYRPDNPVTAEMTTAAATAADEWSVRSDETSEYRGLRDFHPQHRRTRSHEGLSEVLVEIVRPVAQWSVFTPHSTQPKCS